MAEVRVKLGQGERIYSLDKDSTMSSMILTFDLEIRKQYEQRLAKRKGKMFQTERHGVPICPPPPKVSLEDNEK